jgi:hypothetical protein
VPNAERGHLQKNLQITLHIIKTGYLGTFGNNSKMAVFVTSIIALEAPKRETDSKNNQRCKVWKGRSTDLFIYG